MKTISIFTFFLISYSLASADSVVFEYEDFGPQVLAYETIGYQWYQWNSVGDSNPNKTDLIRVVVFWDEPIEKIKLKYPVIPSKQQDYRYLSYEKAIGYLDKTLHEAPGAVNLIRTRERLRKMKGR